MPITYSEILYAAIAAYKAGRWTYSQLSEWKRRFDAAKEAGKLIKAEVLAGQIPKALSDRLPEEIRPYPRPLPEIPVRDSGRASIHRDSNSKMSGVMSRRGGGCKIPAKYFDTFGSSAGTNVVTGGTTQWDANGLLQLAAPTSSTCNWLWPTNVIAGVAGNQRTGNAICLKSFFARIRITPNSSVPVGGAEVLVRLLLIKSLVPSGIAPALSDILQQNAPSTGGMESPLNVSTFGQYKIIKDEVLRVRSATSCGVKPEHLDHYIIWKPTEEEDKKVVWDTDGSTRDVGHMFFMLMNSVNVPSAGVNVITTAQANAPALSVYTRIRFTD